ncbi:pyridoxamine 5'-phosphate oxidase family protein [Maribacter halichondriae]|uniref:pyridoxamine 5'-phosphate oxidase family protein n=1 Tax=Maribacter halichondriae TaxID=2980554 RepID=UPI0023596A4E|nr:pyridoxamine 5'-phosphate oxidase family protein [Maribacter sp. Hal144]
MTDVFFKELKDELENGASLKEHPFRYCALATLGLEKMPRLRTIVLRSVDNSLNLIFYTDTRSKKVLHIKENNRVSLLFYHPEKLLQIRIEGLATIIKDPNILTEHRKNIHESSIKDYTTKTAPGSAISNPDAVEYLDDTDYFCMVNIEPFKIEYLKLKRPNHLRVRFSRSGANWESNFLVP